MSAQVIDGKALSKRIESDLKTRVEGLTPKLGRSPGLAVMLVGENPASKVYVASKSKRAKKCGIEVTDIHLDADVSQDKLTATLEELGARQDVDGILLQLPLPDGLDEFAALTSIAPEKDADGLHPSNQGLLFRGANAPEPCTPKGCMELIREGRRLQGLGDNLSGLNAVIVGRSVLVGKPMALLLLNENCTVTVCHSRTKNLNEVCASADILVAAVGRAEMLGRDAIKPGATVIDVGINRTDEGKLVGDVAYEAAAEVAGSITPVPGGVGPMTIAMLLCNTVDAAEKKL